MSSEEAAATPTKEELIALLRSGKIEEFNRVRPEGKIDLTEASLVGADLTEANLRLANLDGASLVSADLTEANLYNASLQGADLAEANLFEVKGLSEEQRRLIIHKLQASWK